MCENLKEKTAYSIEDGICSHKINMAEIKEIDKGVTNWIKMTFENTG